MNTDIIEVDDASTLDTSQYIIINDENMYVKSITGNKLVVRRAQDNTARANHVKGSQVGKLTKEDDKLIEFGDDFGFSGTYF